MADSAPQDVRLFVLAHPDDEIAFAPLLYRFVRERKPVKLIYLTDGAARGVSPAVRERETLAALRHLGIDAAAAFFAGGDGVIPDGQLYRHLELALTALDLWSGAWGSVAEVYSFAWEGGHPDHDAALVIASAFAAGHGCDVWQVPFYRASDHWPAPLFAVGASLVANGKQVSLILSPTERRLPAQLLRFYPSQWRSFVGLGPALLWQMLTKSRLAIQKLDRNRLRERPTEKLLFYGKHSGIEFEAFLKETTRFLESHSDHRQKRGTTLRRAGAA